MKLLDILVGCVVITGIVVMLSMIGNKVMTIDKKVSDMQDIVYHLDGDLRGDYQIDVDNDSIYVMDGSREVGKFKLEYDKDPLGTLILEDNQ